MLSLAPMRTKTASTGLKAKLSAGTSAPICAITVARHTCGVCPRTPVVNTRDSQERAPCATYGFLGQMQA
eukprot:280420-Pyramimonas_sp.AAC.2